MADDKINPAVDILEKQLRDLQTQTQTAEVLEKIRSIKASIYSLTEKDNEKEQKKINLLEQEYKYMTDILGLAKNNKDVVSVEVELKERKIRYEREILEKQREQLLVLNSIGQLGNDELERQLKLNKEKQEQYDKEEKINELLKERLKATKELGANAYKDLSELGLGLNNLADSTFGSMLANLAFLNGSMDKLRGKIGSIGDSFRQIGLSFQQGVGKGLQNVFDAISPLTDRILGRLASEMNKAFIQNIKDLMDMGPSFVERTGQSVEKFNENISNTFGIGSTELTRFGVGLKEVGESFIALNEASSYFVQSSKETQDIYQETALISKKLGISYDSTAKSLDNMTRGFLISGKQASENFKLIQREALGSAISVGKMGKDFESVFPKLVAQGKQAVSIFIDLAKAANKLGLETSTLLNISEGYDTFEGAAEKAGALNAVLGGDYLNSLEMMNATESERILIMKRSFDASGMQFNSLDKYTKKAVAASLGISDLNEAERLLSSSTSELTIDMMKSAASEEERTKRAEEATKVSEKFNAAMQSMAGILAPAVELFSSIAGGLATLNDKMHGTLGFVTIAILAIPLLAKSFMGARDVIADTRKNLTDLGTGVIDFVKDIKNKGIGEAISEVFKPREEAATPEIPATPEAPSPTAGERIKDFFGSIRDVFISYSNDKSKILQGAFTMGASLALLTLPLIGIAAVIGYFGLDMTPLLELGGALVLFSGSLFILSKISGSINFAGIAALSAGLVVLSVGIAAIGFALQTFISIDFATVMLGITTIGLLTGAIFGLGAILASGVGLAFFLIGIGAFMGLAVAFTALGLGLLVLGKGLDNLGKFLTLDFKNIATIDTAALTAIGSIIQNFEALEDVNPEVVVGVSKVFKEVDNLKTITKDQREAIEGVLSSATQFAVTVNNKTDNALINVLERMVNAVSNVGGKTVVNNTTVAGNANNRYGAIGV
jgi:hypothetical protein